MSRVSGPSWFCAFLQERTFQSVRNRDPWRPSLPWELVCVFWVGSVLWGWRCLVGSPATPRLGCAHAWLGTPWQLGTWSRCLHGHTSSCSSEAQGSKRGPRPPASCPVQSLNTRVVSRFQPPLQRLRGCGPGLARDPSGICVSWGCSGGQLLCPLDAGPAAWGSSHNVWTGGP